MLTPVRDCSDHLGPSERSLSIPQRHSEPVTGASNDHACGGSGARIASVTVRVPSMIRRTVDAVSAAGTVPVTRNCTTASDRSREARGRARAAADVRAWGRVRASRSQQRRAGYPADTGKPASDSVQHVGQSGPLSVRARCGCLFDAIAHEPHHALVLWIPERIPSWTVSGRIPVRPADGLVQASPTRAADGSGCTKYAIAAERGIGVSSRLRRP